MFFAAPCPISPTPINPTFLRRHARFSLSLLGSSSLWPDLFELSARVAFIETEAGQGQEPIWPDKEAFDARRSPGCHPETADRTSARRADRRPQRCSHRFCGRSLDGAGCRGSAEIKPLWPDSAFSLPRFSPPIAVPRDNLGLLVALEVAEPGDVIALATGGFEETAVLGDHVAAMAKNKGVVAFVTDGLVRDVDGLIEVGFPVW